MPLTSFYRFVITFADATSRDVGDIGQIERFYHLVEAPQQHWTVSENEQPVSIADAQQAQLVQLLGALSPLPDPAIEPIAFGSDGTWVMMVIQTGDQQISYRWWSLPPADWGKLAAIAQLVQQLADAPRLQAADCQRQLTRQFFDHLADRDLAGMLALYHPNIHYSNPFSDLHGAQVGAIWRMGWSYLPDIRGDQTRPTSLDPISESELAREAAGLATIHMANMQPDRQLDWLPLMSASYVQDMLFERAWRPAWETAVADTRFAATFRDAIPQVEAAATTIVEDMHALLHEPAAQTLIHADLNPSNVLVFDGKPYFIDWQTAMRGPFYIDLPHHHCTLAQAEHYRQALAAHGQVISRQDFAERYRLAARYIGFRYMWWTLEYWLQDQTQTRWVQHYIGLVTGDGLGRSPAAG
ncbi:MAG: phosphotransferase [Chloroflexota bacterium]|nr:phosphotransferase [Chloroflexota bacterium]